jgi:hypothetical protein
MQGKPRHAPAHTPGRWARCAGQIVPAAGRWMAWSASDRARPNGQNYCKQKYLFFMCKPLDKRNKIVYNIDSKQTYLHHHKQEDKTMKLEFRTKNTAYGTAHYLCIDTNAKTFSRVPDGWVSKDVPVVAKRDMDTIKAQAIADGYTEV